ncbi:MAG: hypothetical protein LBW77_03860 [Verrucomicrobiota bacterium]|nr:hypothetical protein [Verrucomicrobiota bacterium]
MSGPWSATGDRTVSASGWNFELTADGTQLYATEEKTFIVFCRGTRYPPFDPAVKDVLAQPNIVWAREWQGKRVTLAFSPNGTDAVFSERPKCTWRPMGGTGLICTVGTREDYLFLIRDGKGGYALQGGPEGWWVTYQPEPARPGDPLPVFQKPLRADDAEKTKALFADSTWVINWVSWPAGNDTITFSKDGRFASTGAMYYPKYSGAWTVTGERAGEANGMAFELSADGKQLYNVTANKTGFRVLNRGTKPPPSDPAVKEILTQPGIVWVRQGTDKRTTWAFGQDDVAIGKEGVKSVKPWGRGSGGMFIIYPEIGFLLTGKEVAIRTSQNGLYLPERAQPGDPLPPQKTDRAKSPFYGTSWSRLDAKAALHTLTFGTKGTVSDSDFPKESPEWTAYDDQTVRYKIDGKTASLAYDTGRKLLIFDDGNRRDVWFAGKTPPRPTLVETKALKDTLTDAKQVWVCWDEGKKTVYSFDDKSGVSIAEDDGKPFAARWEPLASGSIRVTAGGDAWMFTLEQTSDGAPVLERSEPRLTLKHATPESVSLGAPPPPPAPTANQTVSETPYPPPANTLPEAEFNRLYAERSAKFPAALAKLHAVYTNEVTKLDNERVRASAAALEEYAAGVDRVAAVYAKKADVAGAKAAQAAKEMTYKGGVDTAARQPELAALAATYVKQCETADTRRDGALLALTGQYINALTASVRDLLQKKDIKTAELYRLEIDLAERARYAVQAGAKK